MLCNFISSIFKIRGKLLLFSEVPEIAGTTPQQANLEHTLKGLIETKKNHEFELEIMFIYVELIIFDITIVYAA